MGSWKFPIFQHTSAVHLIHSLSHVVRVVPINPISTNVSCFHIVSILELFAFRICATFKSPHFHTRTPQNYGIQRRVYTHTSVLGKWVRSKAKYQFIQHVRWISSVSAFSVSLRYFRASLAVLCWVFNSQPSNTHTLIWTNRMHCSTRYWLRSAVFYYFYPWAVVDFVFVL